MIREFNRIIISDPAYRSLFIIPAFKLKKMLADFFLLP